MFLNTNGQVLPFENFTTKLQIRMSKLEYYGFVNALPKLCLSTLRYEGITQKTSGDNFISLKIKNKSTSVGKIGSQDLYWELIAEKSEPPTALSTWIDLFPFLETCDWGIVFSNVGKITNEPYFQSFQYKIINRTINCKYNLFKWQLADSPKCGYCNGNNIDTLDHHLFYCEVANLFWKSLECWIKNNLNMSFAFTVCEILLGTNFQNEGNLVVVNYLILLGKWFLNKQKSENQPISFTHFLMKLKSKVKVICNLYKIKKVVNNVQESFEIVLNSL